MQKCRHVIRILILLLSLPLAALAMRPAMPPQVEKAIDHCAEARRAATHGDRQRAWAYCGEAMESLQGVPDAQVMLDAMAATAPEGESWPWDDAAVLAKQGGDAQDRQRFREAWRQARADADDMLEAYLRRTADDSRAADGERHCDTRVCFARSLQQCRDANYSSNRKAGARARYAVVGPVGDDDCQVSLTYTSNPNPDWVDQPLTFVLDVSEPIESQLEAAISACLTATPSDFQCGGPLYETVAADGEKDARE